MERPCIWVAECGINQQTKNRRKKTDVAKKILKPIQAKNNLSPSWIKNTSSVKWLLKSIHILILDLAGSIKIYQPFYAEWINEKRKCRGRSERDKFLARNVPRQCPLALLTVWGESRRREGIRKWRRKNDEKWTKHSIEVRENNI